MDHRIPSRLGRYRLVERIAAGGMAELYRAKLVGASGFERLVAVKCIRPEYARDEQFVRMFVDEAKIAVQLSHPNIAQIIELGREGDVYFIVQEFIHGRDLRAIWKAERRRGSRTPLPITCYLVRSVCEALHYAHGAEAVGGGRLGLVHRDISPQNILLSYEGEVKVVDFGLARAKGRLTQTAAGVVKGKLAYLAPEQSRGGALDHRVDLFALGIVLWEMITGERLFWRGSDVETLRAVREGVVPPLRRFVPDAPVALEHIVARALRREPDERFQEAAEMFDALAALAASAGWVAGRREASAYLQALLPPPDRPSRVGEPPAEPPTALARRPASPRAGRERVAPEPVPASTVRMEVPSELLDRIRLEATEEVSLQEMEEPTDVSDGAADAVPEQAPTILDEDLPEPVRAAAARWREAASRSAVDGQQVPSRDTVEEVLPEGMRTVPGDPLPAEVWAESEPSEEAQDPSAFPAEGPEPDEPPTVRRRRGRFQEESATASPEPPVDAMEPSPPPPRLREPLPPESSLRRSRSLVLGSARKGERSLPRGRVIRSEED